MTPPQLQIFLILCRAPRTWVLLRTGRLKSGVKPTVFALRPAQRPAGQAYAIAMIGSRNRACSTPTSTCTSFSTRSYHTVLFWLPLAGTKYEPITKSCRHTGNTTFINSLLSRAVLFVVVITVVILLLLFPTMGDHESKNWFARLLPQGLAAEPPKNNRK